MKDYYQILEIQQTASESEVKTAYRNLAKKFHPDTNQGNKDAEAKFKEVSEAYETLKDPHKRAVFDNDLAVYRDVSARKPRDNYWANRPNYHDINLDEVLKDIQRGRWSADTKNRDITLAYSITLEEAFTGKDASIRYSIQGVNKEVSVKIPAGIQDGIKLRFKGYGDTAIAGVAAGDLFIRIQIILNPNFTRVDDNLITKISVGYLAALIGSECEIPTIEGTKLKMRIPAGIHPGQTLRAAKKGMPRPDGTRGDMMIEINFVPEKLSEEERQIISGLIAKRNG